MQDSHRGRIMVTKPQPELPNDTSKPVQLTSYADRPKIRKFQKVKIDNFLAQNVNDLEQTELEAPIDFATAKVDKPRFCVGLRCVDMIANQNSISIPRMDKCVHSDDEAALRSILDASSGFCLVEVYTCYCEKKVFKSHHRLYEFILISFERNMLSTPSNI